MVQYKEFVSVKKDDEEDLIAVEVGNRGSPELGIFAKSDYEKRSKHKAKFDEIILSMSST